MKIRRLNESAEFNFNSAASSGNWPYKMSIETYVNICDEISQIIDNLDQSCVFAIARDATNLGLNIDEERLYYSPIVTIENNISPEKINQFRNIVMRYSDEQLNEASVRKFYIDEIVSAPGGKTETERHSFATLDELKQYCKDAGLTKDDIANCGGCDVKDLCEGLEGSLHIQCCPACGCQNEYSDSQDNGSWVRYTCRNCGNTWDIDKPKNEDIVNEEVDKHIPDSRVKLEVKYEVYGRYGTGGQVKKGRVSGDDEVDALMNMLDHVHMYMDSDFANEFEEENGRRPTTEDVVECLDSQNGDGCDLIYYITNLTTGKMIFDGGVSEEEEDWDDLDESADSKLYTKPNGEYLVKADSGKGYTAFSRDNVAIGGIDTEDADSDDKAIDKFKRNEYSECLNEEYFDTAEYRILKYEEDIPELMAGMHDDYMEGKLAAEFYAKALEKVYNALADCDYKHTMSQAVKTETNSQKILNALDNAEPKTIDDAARVVEENLTEGAEKCYAAKYTAVDSEGNKVQKKICFMCDGTIEDAEKLADEMINEPYSELNVIGSVLKDAARKDGFVFVESCNGPVRNKSTCGKRSLKESFDEVGTFTYRYVPDDIGDLPEDVLEKYTEEQIDEFIESKNIPDDLWLTSEAFITYEDGSYQVSHGGWDDYRFYSTIEDCIQDVEGWYDIFEWVDDVSNIEYSAPDEEDYDEYDDEYSDEYDESLEECSGIKAHKVIMGEDVDDSIEFDDVDGVEGPEGDKTEDIEFVMDEYVSESLLIDFIEKVDPVTYRVGANDQVVTVVFDPKWSEYVYTIDGKGPYSHSSYEFISRDIYDFVMSQIDASELDDLDD